MVISDAAVISRVRAGEPEAFALLVERYHARCAEFAVRLLGDSDDAADAVQDAFTRAYLSLDRYEERDRFGAWLLCIVANRCHSMTASARRRAHVAAEWCRSHAAEHDEITCGDHALAGRLADALNVLPAGTRTVLVRKYAEGRTYEEIAADTGATVSALKMRVTRGSAQLRRVLAGAALTVATAILALSAHHPHASERHPAALVACDTLRTLIRDTVSPGARDSLLPPGHCGAAPVMVHPRRPADQRKTTLEHSGL